MAARFKVYGGNRTEAVKNLVSELRRSVSMAEVKQHEPLRRA